MKWDWFWSFFYGFSMETVHQCDCGSESLIGVSSEHAYPIFVQCEIEFFWYLNFSSEDRRQEWSSCANLSIAMHFSSVQPILKTIVNSITILFDTSLPHIVDQIVLFLCFSFAVPSTVGSPLLDDVVQDWESIQSPLVKMLAVFAVNQEVSTSAVDHSLIPIQEAFRELHFWNYFARLE